VLLVALSACSAGTSTGTSTTTATAAAPPAHALEAFQRLRTAGDSAGIAMATSAAITADAARPCPRAIRQELSGAVPAGYTKAPFSDHIGAEVVSVHCDVGDPYKGQYAVIFSAAAAQPLVVDCIPAGKDPITDNICWSRFADQAAAAAK
jgi:hypothetical protein